MRPPSYRRAFTLLETILVVVIVAILLTALGSMLRLSVRAHRSSRASGESETTAWAAMRLIGEDLNRLALQTSADSPVLMAARPDGNRPPLLRVRTHGRLRPGGRAMLVDYFLMPDDLHNGVLVRRSEPLAGPAGPTRPKAPDATSRAPQDGPRYEVIAEGVTDWALRYFDGRQWHDEWDSGQESLLPALVEASIEIEGDDGHEYRQRRALPVIVTAPVLAAAEKGDLQ